MKNARELAQNIKLKNQICKEPFTRVLDLCNIQISQAEKLSKTECYFQVPEFMFGYPLYDISECIRFIIQKLKSNDYHVQYFHPKLLFISWRMDDYTLVTQEKNQENILLDMLNALTCEARKNHSPLTSHPRTQALEHIPLTVQPPTRPPQIEHITPHHSIPTANSPTSHVKVLTCEDGKENTAGTRKRGRKPTKSVNDLKSQGKLTLDLSKI